MPFEQRKDRSRWVQKKTSLKGVSLSEASETWDLTLVKVDKVLLEVWGFDPGSAMGEGVEEEPGQTSGAKLGHQ